MMNEGEGSYLMKHIDKNLEQRIYENNEQFPSDGYERQGKRGTFTKILMTCRMAK